MKTRISFFMSAIIVFLLAFNALTANSQSAESRGTKLAELEKRIEALEEQLVESRQNPFATAIEKAMPAVVKVNVYDTNGKYFSNGSGVIIEDRYILTNYHVIENASYIGVVAVLDEEADIPVDIPVNLIGGDPRTDVAVLKTSDPDFFPLLQYSQEIEWGNSDEIQVGEWAMGLGYPYAPRGETHPTVTVGVVSATKRTMLSENFADLIQTDASINPGNSGGPLVNIDGKLIGINTMIYGRRKKTDEIIREGLGFAIPINTARNIMAQIKLYGCVVPFDLGMETQQVTKKSTSYSLHGFNEVDVSVHVSAVKENGAAANIGIKVGDHIIGVKHSNGTETIVVNKEHFKSLMHIWPIDKKVTLAIVKNKKLDYFTLHAKRPAPKLRMTVRQPNPKDLQKYQNWG
ncbi:MAG: trypsin-like peptidase domain-containing protein [Candidatus Poribacteria bacterium]|nr:trypsin-like peptidase domain-containing protein [Candidatus Poribacteria bacterium]